MMKHYLDSEDEVECQKRFVCRYGECQKNHAASTGGFANDGCGCGEFMSGDSEDPLKCGACGCHRNFHRKQTVEYLNKLLANLLPPSRPLQLSLPPRMVYKKIRTGGYQTMPLLIAQQSPPFMPVYHPGYPGMFGSVGLNKEFKSEMIKEDVELKEESKTKENVDVVMKSTARRYRTKFTHEQKVKMMEFAERLRWNVPKHDDDAVLVEFCSEIGVNRNVMKVWMHNKKHALRVKKRLNETQNGNAEGLIREHGEPE